MAWITPKTDWGSNDGIASTDLNRIEGNIDFLNDVDTALRIFAMSMKLCGNSSVTALGAGATQVLLQWPVDVLDGGTLTLRNVSFDVTRSTSDIKLVVKVAGGTGYDITDDTFANAATSLYSNSSGITQQVFVGVYADNSAGAGTGDISTNFYMEIYGANIT